ncbi:MAG: hypothetical protein ABI255_07515 [Microbacteriaceae bacterium]
MFHSSTTRQVGVLAAAALVAAALSVALPMPVQSGPQLDGQGTSTQLETGQLAPHPDATTVLAFVVTKGQKG